VREREREPTPRGASGHAPCARAEARRKLKRDELIGRQFPPGSFESEPRKWAREAAQLVKGGGRSKRRGARRARQRRVNPAMEPRATRSKKARERERRGVIDARVACW
jgi:hypothetical protein